MSSSSTCSRKSIIKKGFGDVSITDFFGSEKLIDLDPTAAEREEGSLVSTSFSTILSLLAIVKSMVSGFRRTFQSARA